MVAREQARGLRFQLGLQELVELGFHARVEPGQLPREQARSLRIQLGHPAAG